MGKHQFYVCEWDVTIRRGEEILSQYKKNNALVDQGERLMLETFFRNENSPSDFFVGLAYGSMGESSTLDTIPGEPSGNGYGRITLNRDTTDFPTMEQDDGDWVVYTVEKVFEASGGSIGPVNLAFMGANIADGTSRLVSYLSLPVETTMQDGETLTFTLKIKAM